MDVNELNELDKPLEAEVAPYSQDDMHRELVEVVREHLRGGNQPSRALSLKIYRTVIKGVFRELVETGRSQLPSGLGALKLVRRRGQVRKLPNGSMTENREISVIKYVMGTALLQILGRPPRNAYKRTRPTLLEGVRPKSLS